MPWRETQVFEERVHFVQEHASRCWTMQDLCQRFGISRKTGYKYLARYAKDGVGALKNWSRAPHRQGRQVPEAIERSILLLKRQHQTWGAPKLRDWFLDHEPDREWPVSSTIHRILDRHGLVRRRKRRRRAVPSEEPLAHAHASNDVWCADFKGWFRTGDGSRCDPFTVTDAYSRYSLCCRSVGKTDFSSVKKILKRAFQQYGLPRALRTDNGAPFSARAIAGLSRFAIWLVYLDVRIERIEPGEPQQNGRHERFHLTLKQDTASPPANTLRGQQQRFNRFQQVYNEDRPHASLGGRPPGSVFVPSSREYPRKRRELEYPAELLVRKVTGSGRIKLHGTSYFVSEVLLGEYVGLAQQSERHWVVKFGPLELGVLDTAKRKLLPYKRLRYSEESN